MGCSTANILILTIFVASIALRLPSETTARAIADPYPLSWPWLPIYNTLMKVRLNDEAGSGEENGDDESDPPSKEAKSSRKPWPKNPVSKSPPPPF
ncbi:hypothetical protein E5676_scaffold1163G00190 [Cucumis melo var. makuwa]|uniref:Uncharacterized protein n=2 Tax=Cucumis melo TaxID=3656 RepID=A0A5A7UIB8_CUCMM|nr:hypothetical protein E6C27_scaffold43052G00420 [Cucumis melo var. makuwa]TYK22702.1 hypothetical protein E5676_scaffold1163G00190 [Cucumis melo var. makuwa]